MRILEQGFCPAFSFGGQVIAGASESPKTALGALKYPHKMLF
jgi:hypothetical protein